jgi:hypothetical protein
MMFQESLMSLTGAVLFLLVGLVTLSAYSHPGGVNVHRKKCS